MNRVFPDFAAFSGCLAARQTAAFEAASVKLRPSVRLSRPDPAETMRNLFATAWDVHRDHVDEMIVGMPKWMDSARYENPVSEAL